MESLLPLLLEPVAFASCQLDPNQVNISAAGAVYREFKKITNILENLDLRIFWESHEFLFVHNIFKAWEAFRNLPGAHGFVFPKYEPVASHGDPIHA